MVFVSMLPKYNMTQYPFIQNKYFRHYMALIENAKNSTRLKSESYFENHHIIPKSLGGSNKKNNMVLLTAKEHFIAHLLLVRCVLPEDIHKMTAAIARFNQPNSNRYHSIRRTLSKFSIGSLNASHGKKWIHHPITLDIKYTKSIEDYPDYVIGLPYQRGGHRNTKWINNGKEQTLCAKEDLSEMKSLGWVVGKLNPPGIEHMQSMASKRHTKEKDAEHSKKMSGRMYVQHSRTGERKRIHKEQLTQYQSMGFTENFINTNASTRALMIDGKQFMCLEEAALYLQIDKSTVYYRIKSKTQKWKDWDYLP